jgi:hypothetical protein
MKTYTNTYEITYKDAVNLCAGIKSGKEFSWAILERANYTKGTKIFENALDYGIYFSFLAVIRMYKGTGKRPKSVVFAFHSKGCDILSKSGHMLVEDK